MAENTGIEWATHTFNPWIGCTKISPACDFCYAEVWDRRGLHDRPSRWGARAERTRTKTWGNPVKWNKQARAALAVGLPRPRVFCASLADVFDNHPSIQQSWRDDLWALIRETPNLDWLLLTKRPQNIAKFLPADWGEGYPNVWLGVTVENQVEFDRRVPILESIPARIRWLSMEPLLGRVDIRAAKGLHWIVSGGESGPQYRKANPDWFRDLRDACAERSIPFLFKQWQGRNQKEIKALGRALDGVVHDGYPA